MAPIQILIPLALLAAAGTALAADAAPQDAGQVSVKDFQRRTIYHSKQTPGYTCWTAMCLTRSGAPVLTFFEATGPAQGRDHAPAEILQRMPGEFREAKRDFTGLSVENVVMTSPDSGRSWREVSRERFRTCMNFSVGGGLLALRDGSLLRSVWGQVMVFDQIPPTGFVQRSRDGVSWGKPELLSRDAKMQAWPRRLRQLRDGRVIATGAACTYDPATWTWSDSASRYQPCYWVSDGPACSSWSGPHFFAAEGSIKCCEEWDVVELPGGALLGVIRTPDGQGQFTLAKRGDGWAEAKVVGAPFPQSGHPELLATREGPILYLNANGIWATLDHGVSWAKAHDVPDGSWYPVAEQLADGQIIVASHLGYDDEYGARDQAIVLDSFRVELKKPQ